MQNYPDRTRTSGNGHGGMQRHSRNHPCLVCGGYDQMPRGEGRRCSGFLSADGLYVHCSREEYAGSLPLHPGSGTYAHLAAGSCKCGVEHAPGAQAAPPAERGMLKIVATYDYRDADGALLFQTVRLDPKDFKQRRPDPASPGKWKWDLQGVTPVLYRLPELRAAADKAVFVVEGEKDVETLRTLGLVATCNAMGAAASANKWRPEYAREFAGRQVVVLTDNDPVGRQHGLNIANQLAVVATSVRMVELPGLEEHGDVSDWIAAGHTRAELEQRVKDTPVWGKDRREAPPRRVVIPTARELLAKVLAEPRMVVDTLIPEGTTLLVANPKVGKTLLMEHVAIAVAQGGYVMGKIKVAPGRAVYLALEDSERLCQKRILQLLHGKECPEKLHIQNSWRRFDEGGIEDLDAWLAEHPDTRLVVVDTLARVRPRERPGAGIYQQDYAALQPLTDLSHKYNIAIVVVHHTRKMAADDLMDMVSGSAALGAVVDAVLVLQRERFGNDGVLGVMGRDLEEARYAVVWDKDLMQLRIVGNAEDFAQSKEQNAILAVLKHAKRALRIQEIADLVGRSANSALRMLLGKLVERGLAVALARGEYKATVEGKVVMDGADLSTCHLVTANDAEEAEDPVEESPWQSPFSSQGEEASPVYEMRDDNSDKMTSLPHTSDDSSDKMTSDQGAMAVYRSNQCPNCKRHYSRRPSGYVPGTFICSNCGVDWPDAVPQDTF